MEVTVMGFSKDRSLVKLHIVGGFMGPSIWTPILELGVIQIMDDPRDIVCYPDGKQPIPPTLASPFQKMMDQYRKEYQEILKRQREENEGEE
jgi:hypothetical protein